MAKSRDAFRTISEVSTVLDTPTHVLRFWESKFAQIKPVKRAGGRRYYRPEDVDLLSGIKTLLHDHGMTIKGAQKLMKEQGVKHVVALGAELGDEADAPQMSEAVTPKAAVEEAPPAPLKVVEAPAEVVQPPEPKLEPVEVAKPVAEPVKMPTAPAPKPIVRAAILSDIAIPNQIMISKNAAKIAPLLAKLETLRNRMQAQ